MKLLIFVSCLLVAIQLTTQKAMVEPGCTEAMLVNVKQHIEECFLIECSTGVGRIIACMNDICPPGQMIIGREPDDNTKTYPGCCGQLICANITMT